MKPTRPLETFDKWYRHQITLTMDEKGYPKVHRWLKNKGLFEKDHYLEAYTLSGRQYRFFYFDDINHAAMFLKRFSAKYELLPAGHGPMRNKPIFTHFTMSDLKTIFGDPLPRKIQFLLSDLKRRGINYFESFYYMHHEWCDRDWWPEAFIYGNNTTQEEWLECMRWCRDNNITEVKSHACNMWEFGRINDAMRFKLAFGEARLPAFTETDIISC